MTADQVTVLVVGWIAGGLILSLFLGSAARVGGRHVAAPRTPDDSGPVTQPVPLGHLHGMTADITLPVPRPYTGGIRLPGIPALLVDSPPGAHGTQPATGLPVIRQWSCTLCHDGTLIPGRSGACVWCGHPAVTS